MNTDEKYIARCIELGKRAGKQTRTNPNVGSVLVLNDRILAEDYHRHYGGPHAERAVLEKITSQESRDIEDAVLYISLEPCSTTGKTPPCTDIILEKNIKKVVVSTQDPNPEMGGRSLQMLREAGISVNSGVLEQSGEDLIKPFRAHLAKRPYIILKFAQSRDGFMGRKDQQIWLSNRFSRLKAHKWRAEADGILVGYNTALTDNPSLTTRLVKGENPVRIVLDKQLSLPREYRLWSDPHETIFVCQPGARSVEENKKVISLDRDRNFLSHLMEELFERGINYLMVEGGKTTLDLFLKENLWDEARVITCPLELSEGIRSPFIKGRKYRTEKTGLDLIEYLYRE